MKNRFLKAVVIIITIASFVGVFFVMSIMDLVNTKDVHETTITDAGRLLVVENSINGIIPNGKDYYYVGIDGSTGDIYTIHAGKKWLDDNFTIDGIAKGGGLYIKGLSKSVSDFEVRNEIADRVAQMSQETGCNLALTRGYVLELNYVVDAIIRLIGGVVLTVAVLLVFIFRNRTQELPPLVRKLMVVLFVLALLFALWIIV